MTTSAASPCDVAIVGVSALFPGSIERSGFWRDIVAGRDRITEVPSSHWLIEDYYDPDPAARDKVYAKRGAFLSPVPFDPLEFGILPNAVPATDTAQLLALIVAKQVLNEAANGDLEKLDRDRISVILGVASATELVCSMSAGLQRPVWIKALRESGLPEGEVQAICERIAAQYVPWQENTFPGLLGNVVAGRIANRLDLGGTNCVVDAACASSLSALAIGLQELELGRSDLVITGGVDALNDILMFTCFSKTTALSPSGDCRPFSDQADGTLLGEGIGMFALRRLADAERDGNPIYAVIKGVGSSSDGRAKSIYGPRAGGQAKALRRAYEQAGYGTATVELLEAHGTGTKAGDLAEFEGLGEVFEASAEHRQWCALGSIKSQIGHTKAAAGAAGLFKAVMALRHRVLPPTIKVERPNPSLDLDASAFYLNPRSRPWIGNARHPRRAAVSSFGFGGTNYHVTLEEYRGPGKIAKRLRALSFELVMLSAGSASELARQCTDHSHAHWTLGDFVQRARRSQQSFDSNAGHRLALVVESGADLENKLATAAQHIEQEPGADFRSPSGIFYAGKPASPGKLAFLFPGQGSQYLDMGVDLAVHFDAAAAVWEQAPYNLPAVVFPTPTFTSEQNKAQSDALTAMVNAQPAIAAVSLSQLRLLNEAGVRPDCLTGHSFGEVTALHASGCFSAETLLELARRRGQLMTEAAALTEQPGAMLAVQGERAHVAQEIERLALQLTIANHNAPRQVVLSGAESEIVRAESALGKLGLNGRRLAVASAFHSPLVSASSEPLHEYLTTLEINEPALPVYANANAMPYPAQISAICRQLADQLSQPVRFVEQIDALYDAGVRVFVEVGPGNVLSHLVGQCLEGRPHRAIAMDRKGQDGLFVLWTALAELALAGVALDFEPLWAGFDLPPENSQHGPHVLNICGANYGKPYPAESGTSEQAIPSVDSRPESSSTSTAGPRACPDIANSETPSPIDPGLRPSAVPVEIPGLSNDRLSTSATTLEAVHRQIAAVQSEFQRTLGESHQAYLQMARQALSAMVGQEDTVQPAPFGDSDIPAPPTTAAGPALALPVDVSSPSPGETTMTPPPNLSQPLDHSEIMAPVAPSFPGATQQSAPPTGASEDIAEILLGIVAEKTGYPAEMLELDMELEATLGIDSIKRVEILAALQDRLPHLPEPDPAALADLKTLGQISEFMRARSETKQAEQARNSDEATQWSVSADLLERYTVQRVLTPPCVRAVPGIREARQIVITPDGSGIAKALATALAGHGLSAEVSRTVTPTADAVICLDGLHPDGSPEHSLATHLNVFRTAQGFVKNRGGDGVFITVHDSGGDFGLSGTLERAWLSGVPGIAKTARHEWQGSAIKCIDLERGERSAAQLAQALIGELFEGGEALEVGLKADGQRIELTCEQQPFATNDLPAFEAGSVIVVAGGGRGVTAAAMEALAQAYQPRLLLLGRTALRPEPACCRDISDPAGLKRALLGAARDAGEEISPVELAGRFASITAVREVRATLRRLEESGSTVRYETADICDSAAVAAAVDVVRREWGPVRGVIHAAGVLADKRIEDKTAEQFERVFRTKVDGLNALLRATADDPLKLIALFGSVAGRNGNIGQCDYAAANEVLNRVALAEARRRGDACRLKALNWGPWDGGMVTPALRAHFQDRGVALIPLAAGAAHFVRELSDGGGPVELVISAPASDCSAPVD